MPKGRAFSWAADHCVSALRWPSLRCSIPDRPYPNSHRAAAEPAVLSGVNHRVLNYREFSFGPSCAFRFNFQRVVQRGQPSYVVAVMAPSDFAQL